MEQELVRKRITLIEHEELGRSYAVERGPDHLVQIGAQPAVENIPRREDRDRTLDVARGSLARDLVGTALDVFQPDVPGGDGDRLGPHTCA